MATDVGTMLGTVDYMAPERALGDPVDALADVYALGATLFKALTGLVPFPGDQELASIVAKLDGPPPAAAGPISLTTDVAGLCPIGRAA